MNSPLGPARLFLLPRFLAAVWLFVSVFALTARGTVTYSGSVDPEPPSVGGNINDDLLIGTDAASGDDMFGMVEVAGGVFLAYDQAVLGEDTGYYGDLTVTGSGTVFQLDSSSESDPALQVGDEGVGTLVVENQAHLKVYDSGVDDGDIVIGNTATGVGYVEVTGHLSRLSIGERLTIGNDGYGRLTISDRAVVQFTVDTDAHVTLGDSATGEGVAYVQGDATIWQIPENLIVGNSGVGLLNISDGAIVSAGGTSIVGARGRIELAGGSFLGDTLSLSGVLSGDGLVSGDVSVLDEGEVVVGAGELLRMTGAVDNLGVIEASGGEIEFVGGVINADPGISGVPGRIAATDATIRFYEPFTNGAVLASAFGQNEFYGEITNSSSGSIVVAGDSGATFYGSVDVGSGSLTVFEDATALLLGDADFGAGALMLQIGDGLSSSSRIEVAGIASLDGSLEVSLAGDVEPQIGDTYSILEAAGGVMGTFDTESLPILDNGLEWSVDYRDNAVVLEVVGPAGDYDLDGDVDINDLMAWQRTDGTSAGLSAWQDGFGTQAMVSISVPEPSGVLLLGVFGGLLATGHERRRGSAHLWQGRFS